MVARVFLVICFAPAPYRRLRVALERVQFPSAPLQGAFADRFSATAIAAAAAIGSPFSRFFSPSCVGSILCHLHSQK